MRRVSPWVLLLLTVMSAPASGAAADIEQNHAALVFREGTDEAAVKDWWLKHKSSDLKLVYRFRTIPALLVTGDAVAASRLGALRSDPAIEFVDTGAPVEFEATTPDDPLLPGQWWVRNDAPLVGDIRGRDLDLLRAWDITTGNDVRVAVIDRGVDVTHPDIAANCLPGYDFVGHHPGVASDPHGTACAGIIGAVGNNAIGVAGVNWQVRILPLSMYYTDQAAAAIDSAVVWGAKVINASWVVHATDGSFSVLTRAFARAMQAGVIVASAAGNYGNDMDLPGNALYPASYDYPLNIAVAAAGGSGVLWVWSNRGARTVDIAAPGAHIGVCCAGGGYCDATGTSVAAPMVAGAAALLIGRYPSAEPQWIVDRLLDNAESLYVLDGLVAGGRWLNVFRALDTSDRIAPALPAQLQVAHLTSREATLTWIAPGDDGDVGQLDQYEAILYFRGEPRRLEVAPAPPGELQTLTIDGLSYAETYECYVAAVDDARNRSVARITFTTLPRPVASVRDAYLFTGVLTGGIARSSTWIRNDGADDLSVRASAAQGAAWLSVAPVAFTVAAGDSVEVVITARATGVCDPMLSGAAVFETNDPLRPTLQTQVFVVVTPAPEIAVPRAVDLGAIPVGASGTSYVQIRNIGCSNLAVTGIRLSLGRRCVIKAAPCTLAAGGSRTVKIVCSTGSVGAIADTLVIESDSPYAAVVRVPIAAGIVPPTPPVKADEGFTCAPNPFNPQTSFQFTVDRTGEFTIGIYDLQGALIRRLSGRAGVGDVTRVTWRGDDSAGREAPSGIYLCRLQLDGRRVGGVLKINLVR